MAAPAARTARPPISLRLDPARVMHSVVPPHAPAWTTGLSESVIRLSQNHQLGVIVSSPFTWIVPRVALKLTGYYRPEDADIDRAAEADGRVRFCANDTGNEGEDKNFGETICVTDGTLEEALANTATPALQSLVIGTPDFAMMDNIAYQPRRGNWVILEDGDGPAEGRNNDIFDCLDDFTDSDLLSDGCIRIATLNDLTAESTGGIFDAAGNRFWVSIQHNVTGHGVVLEIMGWRYPKLGKDREDDSLERR